MSCENCSQNTIIKELCGFRYQGLSRLECYDHESSLKIPRALVMKTENKKIIVSSIPSTSIAQGGTRLIVNKRGERILVLQVKRSCKIRSLNRLKLLILRAVLETMVKLIRLWLNGLFFFPFFFDRRRFRLFLFVLSLAIVRKVTGVYPPNTSLNTM